jgi:hypothetical protein
LRRRRRSDVDRPSRVIVPKHLPCAGERKRLNRNIGLVQQLQGLGIGGVREESGAKRMEDASEWVVSRVRSAMERYAVEHLLVIVPCLALTTNFFLTVEHHGLDTLLLKSSCRRQACGAGANDAYGLLIFGSSSRDSIRGGAERKQRQQ